MQTSLNSFTKFAAASSARAGCPIIASAAAAANASRFMDVSSSQAAVVAGFGEIEQRPKGTTRSRSGFNQRGICAGAFGRRSRPLALAEHRRASAVRIEAVDVDLVRADHPVDMDHALVAAPLRDLLGRELRAVDEALRVALPERDVAGGVLVEQRVEEQKAALRNRR